MAIDLRFRSATRRGYVSIVREVRGVVVGWWTGFPTWKRWCLDVSVSLGHRFFGMQFPFDGGGRMESRSSLGGMKSSLLVDWVCAVFVLYG